MRNKILINRLNECGITIDDILSKVRFINDQDTIFIYTSHLEGLGNKDSDFDIYVITNELYNNKFARNYQDYNVSIEIINGIMLDIEHWKHLSISNIIGRLNEFNTINFKREELSLIHRLKTSVTIKGEERGEEIKKLIKESQFEENVMKFQSVYAKSCLEDAVQMYNSQRYIPALNCARVALEHTIGAINAKHGFTTLKSKWNSKIFLDNKCYHSDYNDQYLKLQVYANINKDNLVSHIEEIIEFTQDVLSGIYI